MQHFLRCPGFVRLRSAICGYSALNIKKLYSYHIYLVHVPYINESAINSFKENCGQLVMYHREHSAVREA